MTKRRATSPAREVIQVALPVPLRQTFSYRVPEDLSLPVPGSRVRVPFGKRKLIGFVVDDPGASPPERLKFIDTVLDDTPLLPPEILKFTRWISDYYLASWGQTLRCAYPGGLDPVPRSIYYPVDQNLNCRPDLRPLLDALTESPKTDAQLRRKLGPNFAGLLNGALREGLVFRGERLSRVRTRAGRDRVANLLNTEESRRKLEHPDTPPPVQKVLRVLESYREKGYPEVAEVARQAKVPQYVLQDMAAQGLVELFELVPANTTGVPFEHPLTSDQLEAVSRVRSALSEHRHETFLLYGITGSGKTEVYLTLIEEVLDRGGTALYLVPEISLTSFLARRLIERLGSRVAILHSSMTEREKVRQWLRARSGEARVVIGPRSALFAPLPGLEVIIVDEEHDASFKQREQPRYHARDMAVLLGAQRGIPVLLGSATPSVESYYNATEAGKYTLLTLASRPGSARLPKVQVVDMRGEFERVRERTVLSKPLKEAVAQALAEKRQVVVLRNRLGFSTFILCRKCGKTLQCTDCAVALTYHRRRNLLKCHYCGRSTSLPEACPDCGAPYLQYLGEGTEKIEDLIAEEFPSASIARMDREAVRRVREFDRIWREFERGKIDILVGTQMVAKGHDIHNVTLVGILSADFILGVPDFRSAERTFQLITQAAGRAGRGRHSGRVFLQSFHPEHYAVEAAARQDYSAFFQKDAWYRRVAGYPPYSALARVELRHAQAARAGAWADEARRILKSRADSSVRLLGPAPAPLARLEGKYRVHLILKAPTRARLQKLLSELLEAPTMHRAAGALDVEIDPMSLL